MIIYNDNYRYPASLNLSQVMQRQTKQGLVSKFIPSNAETDRQNTEQGLVISQIAPLIFSTSLKILLFFSI